MNNKVKGDVKMTKIKIMSVRDEDMPYIKAWAEKHHVEVDITKEALTDDNVEDVASYDGLSLSQQIPLSEHVYKRLNELGIKQIAQRSAGFDTYDLELANKYNLIVSNVPSYSPNSIAEFAVTQAINVVRHFNQIQTKVREHDFRWEPTILSKSIKDLKVAVIGTGRIGRVVADIFANGVIKGAALDTYEFERKLFPSDQRGKTLNDPLLESLIDREDVILTPHIAFYTEAAVENLIVDALDATLDVLQTGDTRLRVN